MAKIKTISFYDYDELLKDVQAAIVFDERSFDRWLWGQVLRDDDELQYPLVCWEEVHERFGGSFPQWEPVLKEFVNSAAALTPERRIREGGKVYGYVRMRMYKD